MPSTVMPQPSIALKPYGASDAGSTKIPMPIVLPTTRAVHIQNPSSFRCCICRHAPLPCSASSSAVRSKPTASSISAVVVESGGMKRSVLTPHESSSSPLW